MLEPIAVVVEVDEAYGDGSDAPALIEAVALRNALEERAFVGFKEFRGLGSSDQVVIYTEEQVGERGTLGQNGAVDGLASVATFNKRHLDARRVGKRLDNLCGDVKRAVRQDGQLLLSPAETPAETQHEPKESCTHGLIHGVSFLSPERA